MPKKSTVKIVYITAGIFGIILVAVLYGGMYIISKDLSFITPITVFQGVLVLSASIIMIGSGKNYKEEEPITIGGKEV